ncbi:MULTISPECIES: type IV pilin protein [Stenotrophomonas]|jgi:type IV pilus assembly protein PilE|uniref:type IV pilin protein n=1 Tax=Stenotrophomonas TaxID=40323 RepID=UPI00111FBA5E|nr:MULTISPECIES: type IV pilin protein [Stenotrophomonas]MBO1747587.1 type IV pilin protein [Stenotrophomonas indicatrix]TPD91862.1 type IV pilin protein [Stenotrophomonas maltophilia]
MKTCSRRRMARGFTLIELMITVAVVAILAAVAIPSYSEHVRKSRRAQAKADLVELAQQLERFHTVQNTYSGMTLPFTQSPRDGKSYYTLSLSGAATSSAFTLQAVPGTGQDKDKCGTLTLDQAGRKTPTAAKVAGCW